MKGIVQQLEDYLKNLTPEQEKENFIKGSMLRFNISKGKAKQMYYHLNKKKQL